MGTVVRLEGAGISKDATLSSGSDGADRSVIHSAGSGAALALVLESEVCLGFLAVVELEHAGVSKNLKFTRGGGSTDGCVLFGAGNGAALTLVHKGEKLLRVAAVVRIKGTGVAEDLEGSGRRLGADGLVLHSAHIGALLGVGIDGGGESIVAADKGGEGGSRNRTAEEDCNEGESDGILDEHGGRRVGGWCSVLDCVFEELFVADGLDEEEKRKKLVDHPMLFIKFEGPLMAISCHPLLTSPPHHHRNARSRL